MRSTDTANACDTGIGNASGTPTCFTRRGLILGSIAMGATVSAGQASAAAAIGSGPGTVRTRLPKVDVHHHMIPPVWADALRSGPSAQNLRKWSPEASLAFMDTHEIQTAMLSLTSPGPSLWQGDERRQMFRKVNEYGAAQAQATPTRFGFFAALPLPDIDGALKELEYALDHLRADGVILMSNIGDQYLGDKLFAPLWAELDRRETVVFIHPNTMRLPDLPGIPSALVDFTLATTRTAVDMVVHGIFTLQSKVKVILPHAGGFLPYISQRLVKAGSTLPGAPNADVLLQIYRRFYFDTALSTSPPALSALMKFADPGHILFGSDFPYGAGLAGEFTDTLDHSGEFTDLEYKSIANGNAARLFSRRFVP